MAGETGKEEEEETQRTHIYVSGICALNPFRRSKKCGSNQGQIRMRPGIFISPCERGIRGLPLLQPPILCIVSKLVSSDSLYLHVVTTVGRENFAEENFTR